MPLLNYGLLTGRLIDHGPQQGGNPHYLLVVKGGITDYRVAINLDSTRPQGDKPAILQYQIRDLKGSRLAGKINNQETFVLCDQDPSTPRLDYIRDGLVEMGDFQNVGFSHRRNELYKNFAAAAKLTFEKGDFVAVFGSGYPDQDDRPPGPDNNPLRSSNAFTGVDNVHMNQGSYLRVGTHESRNFQQNGINQDGAVIFFQAGGAVLAFFTKFSSQDTETDDYGNPRHTGVEKLDSEINPAVRKKLLKRNASLLKLTRTASSARKPKTDTTAPPRVQEVPISGTSGGVPTDGFVFGSPSAVEDPNHVFKDDDDSQYRNSPFVEGFAKYGVPEPVPGPRDGDYPTMSLADVLGKSAVDSIISSKQIVFHVVGDTGAPAASKLPKETSVADLMLQDFQPPDEKLQPKFFFHLGDVVYFYGEQDYYYDQFYKPYKDYPAPIFAIPGNHDGITYLPEMVSLDGFIKAFCDDKPRHWSAAGGLERSTMTQPGVYFTLDAPFVSIIGLYTNCSESYGYLDDQQKLFLYKELERLKKPRQQENICAVLLAVHHSPLSFAKGKPASQALRDTITTACEQVGYWPDAILSGHAHIYQRIVRTIKVGTDQWEIPHIIGGSGGYGVNARQEVDKQDMTALDATDSEFVLHKFYAHFGYLKLTVTPRSGSKGPTLRSEFLSPDINDGQPADVCVLDLDQHKLILA